MFRVVEPLKMRLPRTRYHRMLATALQDEAGTEAFSPAPWSGAQALEAIDKN